MTRSTGRWDLDAYIAKLSGNALVLAISVLESHRRGDPEFGRLPVVDDGEEGLVKSGVPLPQFEVGYFRAANDFIPPIRLYSAKFCGMDSSQDAMISPAWRSTNLLT